MEAVPRGHSWGKQRRWTAAGALQCTQLEARSQPDRHLLVNRPTHAWWPDSCAPDRLAHTLAIFWNPVVMPRVPCNLHIPLESRSARACRSIMGLGPGLRRSEDHLLNLRHGRRWLSAPQRPQAAP